MSDSIDILIKYFSDLPALGPRSARRAVLHLLKKKEGLMIPLKNTLTDVIENTTVCPICGNIDTSSPCHICADTSRRTDLICIVSDISDVWALERCQIFNGKYHVLGGVLSPLDGIGPDELNISTLLDRINNGKISEIILALPATVDGQTTAHYLSDILSEKGATITYLSHGIPMGGELDYLDDGTIGAAFKSRRGV